MASKRRRSDNIIVTGGYLRQFLQIGNGDSGAGPESPTLYAGNRTQFFYVDGISNPATGGVTAITMHDPDRLKGFIKVENTVEAPDAPEADLVFSQKQGGMPVQLYNLGICPITVYTHVGKCKTPGDFDLGWSSYVKVFSNGILSDRDEGGQGGWNSDEAIEDTLSMTWDRIYIYGPMSPTNLLDLNTPGDIVGVGYGSAEACASCANGDEHLYVINKFGELWYSTDKGGSWVDYGAIDPTFDSDWEATFMIVVGNQLVIGHDLNGSDEGGYFLGTLNEFTGVPASFAEVGTGFGEGVYPVAAYALSPTEVVFVNNTVGAPDAGTAATICIGTNLQVGVTPVLSGAGSMRAVDGSENVIVAVGNYLVGGGVYSLDRGQTWTEFQNFVPGGDDGVSVGVISRYRWWVGNANGLYYTVDGDTTWELVSLATPDGPVQIINQILWVNNEIGYLLASSDKYDDEGIFNWLLFTTNGGYTWRYSGPRLVNTDYPYIQVMAVPEQSAIENVAVNNILLGCDAASGIIHPQVYAYRGIVL